MTLSTVKLLTPSIAVSVSWEINRGVFSGIEAEHSPFVPSVKVTVGAGFILVPCVAASAVMAASAASAPSLEKVAVGVPPPPPPPPQAASNRVVRDQFIGWIRGFF